MSVSPALVLENKAKPEACVICTDIEEFDILSEDMLVEFDDAWISRTPEEAYILLESAAAAGLRAVIFAVNDSDEDDLQPFLRLIAQAREKSIAVGLVADNVSPIALHQLMRAGAEDFAPYPLPEGALHDMFARLERPPVPALAAPQAPTAQVAAAAAPAREGVVLGVHGLAGGVGASTFAVNLAWELAKLGEKSGLKVALIDLDFEFGSAATYLDLPRREAVFELLSDPERIEGETLLQAMETYGDVLRVLTAPPEAVPYDFVEPDNLEHLIDVARAQFDVIVVDMPTPLIGWTDRVLNAAQVYFALLEMDMRSAQNALRFLRALKAEDLPYEKVRFILNRAPGLTELSGKARVKRLAETLNIDLDTQLSDGGKSVTHSGDHGSPLGTAHPRLGLRKEILKLAKSLHDVMQAPAQKN